MPGYQPTPELLAWVRKLSDPSLMAFFVDLRGRVFYEELRCLTPRGRDFIENMPERWISAEWMTWKRRRFARDIIVNVVGELERRADLQKALRDLRASADAVAPPDSAPTPLQLLKTRLIEVEREREELIKRIHELEQENPRL